MGKALQKLFEKTGQTCRVCDNDLREGQIMFCSKDCWHVWQTTKSKRPSSLSDPKVRLRSYMTRYNEPRYRHTCLRCDTPFAHWHPKARWCQACRTLMGKQQNDDVTTLDPVKLKWDLGF